MSDAPYTVGRLVAALGALGLFGSLFMPWYGPPSAGYLTIFGDRAVDWFSDRHNLDGWQALSVIDIYLFALAAVAVFISAAGLRRVGRTAVAMTAVAAAIGVGLVVYRLAEPVVPFHEPIIYGPTGKPAPADSWVDPRIGIYVALTSATAILVGSILLTLRHRVTRAVGVSRTLPDSAR
jgi:hypothetical protein